jgi:ATP-binding cassette subfamily C (CFTR/MRP) protein 5
MQSSRELKRLEGLSRSPIYSSFSEMLQGIETIRAFHRQTEFVTQHVESIDRNASLFVLFWLTSRWLAIRLDFLAVLVMVTLSFLAAVLVENGRFDIISPAMLSLALIYCLQLTGLLQWTIRLVVETEVSTQSEHRA